MDFREQIISIFLSAEANLSSFFDSSTVRLDKESQSIVRSLQIRLSINSIVIDSICR